jgi:folylpolyglutamate synthase/dihydropteroate synthase
MLTESLPVAGVMICTTAPTARAASADALAELVRRHAPVVPLEAIANPADALARAAAVRSRVVIAGSIFLTGPVRAILRES